MKLTWAAILMLRDTMPLQAAQQVNATCSRIIGKAPASSADQAMELPVGSVRGLTPMGKRRRTGLLLLAVVGLTFAGLYEADTHVGRGWLRGEAFFQSRPTSYWRVLIELDLRDDPKNLRVRTFLKPPLTFWEHAMDRIGARHLPRSSAALNYQSAKSAESVLIELANDPDEKIAGFGRDIVEIQTWGPPELSWELVVNKHHIE